MAANWTWDDMLTEFRSLGGVADNICIRHGPLGRGLFTLDSAKPIHIHVPDNLLVSSDDVECKEGRLRVKTGGASLSLEQDFFERYQEHFSWGGGGRESTENVIDLFSGIPEPISEKLSKYFGRSIFSPEKSDESVLHRFLSSRRLRTSDNKKVLMPVLELANHDIDGSPFKFKNGISLLGSFSDEIYARYNITDPLGSFATWGFSGTPHYAFSLPLKVSLGSHTILIKRNLSEKTLLSKVRVPIVSRDGNTITFSHLMIGNMRSPRRVRSIFQTLLKPFNVPKVDEAFDRIRGANLKRCIDILISLEDFEGESISALRRMAHLQLEAISNCYGKAALAEGTLQARVTPSD